MELFSIQLLFGPPFFLFFSSIFVQSVKLVLLSMQKPYVYLSNLFYFESNYINYRKNVNVIRPRWQLLK